MSVAEPQVVVPTPSIRRYRITSDRVVVGLLVLECLLWLSQRFGWLPWHKGYAVLTAVASVGVAILLMPVWFAVALFSDRLPVQYPLTAGPGCRRGDPMQLAGGRDARSEEAERGR